MSDLGELKETQSSEDRFVALARFETLALAQEYALVVLAMNLDCLITIEPEGYLIHANESFTSSILEEFRLYQLEQQNAPKPSPIPVFGSGVEWALAWALVLLICFSRQLENPSMSQRLMNSSTEVIGNLQLYRPLTSLFLHADFEHLMGNVVFGVIFGVLVANTYSPLLGWGLVLLSGSLGNLLTSWIHYPDAFRSLGASTGVFGALGLLVASGLSVAWDERSYRKGLRAFTPLIAGAMIFMMNGIGGPEVDSLSHLTGMSFGILLGFPVTQFLAKKSSMRRI